MAPLVEEITTFLAATDSRDKLLKGIACFFKLLSSTSGSLDYMRLGLAATDARCVMRLFMWLNHVQKLKDVLRQSKVLQMRNIILILRFLSEGTSCFFDNVVYIGHFAYKKSQLARYSQISRATLFYGYLIASILDVYDLLNDKNMPNKNERSLVLTRNVLDTVASVGNVSDINIGLSTASALGLISALISCREMFMSAQKVTALAGATKIKRMK